MCFTASDVLLFDIKQLRPGLMLKTSLQSICILIDGLLCTPSTRQSSTMFVVLEQALQVLQACFDLRKMYCLTINGSLVKFLAGIANQSVTLCAKQTL